MKMDFNRWATVAFVVVGVTLGGCHVLKPKSEAKHATAPVKKEVVLPAASLEELNIRLTNVERRLDAAKAARAKAAARRPVVVQ